jgi:hypothetical protein
MLEAFMPAWQKMVRAYDAMFPSKVTSVTGNRTLKTFCEPPKSILLVSLLPWNNVRAMLEHVTARNTLDPGPALMPLKIIARGKTSEIIVTSCH